jgi:hypothetical protein
MVADGSDVYVAWREKGADDTRRGIYVRRRKSDGAWEPTGEPDGSLKGYRLSDDQFDGSPAMDAAGQRLYVMWDRYTGESCGTGLDSNKCVQDYALKYRVLTDTNLVTAWWPVVGAQDVLLDDDSAVVATSHISTTGESGDVPAPDDYYTGARPSLKVIEASGVYTPLAVWHSWVRTPGQANYPPEVDSYHPYKVHFLHVHKGDLGTARWDSTIQGRELETVGAMGADRIFAAPLLAWTDAATGGGYDLHFVLNVLLGDEGAPWDVLYTNPYRYYWAYLPGVFKNYP